MDGRLPVGGGVTPDEVKTELSNGLMQMLDACSPMLDAAEGLKADMERRGWSPTAAEQVACSWLLSAQAMAWKGTS